MALFSEMQQWNGTRADAERERRMNNWIRSYALPTGEQRDIVQSAMIRNPWGMQDATTRMEALNSDMLGQLNDASVLQRPRAAYMAAMDRFNNGIAVQDAMSAARQTPVQAKQQREATNPVTQGEINGRVVAVPTAGNYLNGAYQQAMSALGLPESAEYSAYQQALQNYQSPQDRLQLALAQLKNEGFANKARIDAAGKIGAAAAKPTAQRGNASTQSRAKVDAKADELQKALQSKMLGEYENVVKTVTGVGMDAFKADKVKNAMAALGVPVREMGGTLQPPTLEEFQKSEMAKRIVDSMVLPSTRREVAASAAPGVDTQQAFVPQGPQVPPTDDIDRYVDRELGNGKDIESILQNAMASGGRQFARDIAVRYARRYAPEVLNRINNASRGLGRRG
jgi:hypothetical protein